MSSQASTVVGKIALSFGEKHLKYCGVGSTRLEAVESGVAFGEENIGMDDDCAWGKPWTLGAEKRSQTSVAFFVEAIISWNLEARFQLRAAAFPGV